MKKLTFVMLFMAMSMVTFAQTREIYTNPQFKNLAVDHKEIAILPFHAIVELRPNQRRSMTDQEFYDLESSEALAVQSALHSYFLKRKEKHEFSVEFQNITKTNAILQRNGVTNENIASYTPEELSEMLGVDAVVTGIFNTSKPMSDGAALAMGVLVGFYGPTNSGKISINISDGMSGNLLWKYEKTLSRSLGSSTNQVINTMMRKASKKFPYNKI